MKILSEFPQKISSAPTKQTQELLKRRKITVAKRPVKRAKTS